MNRMIKSGGLALATAGALALTAAPSMAQVSFGFHVGSRYHNYYRHHRHYRSYGYYPGYYDNGYYDNGYYDAPYGYGNCWVWSPYYGRYVHGGYCD